MNIDFSSAHKLDEAITTIRNENGKYDEKSFIHFTLYGLNFIILHKINQLLKFAIDDVKEELNKAVTKTKLSTLHIAVLSENLKAVKKILEENIDINTIDRRKWTPLHHAALMGQDKIIELFLNHKGINTEAKTDTGLTYIDIIRLTKPRVQKNLDLYIPIFIKQKNGELKALTYQEFRLLTNANYIEEYIISQERFISDWKNPEDGRDYYFPYFSDKLKKKFIDFLKYPSPSFILEKVKNDSMGKQLPFSPGLGLAAINNYNAGEPIGEYIGEMTLELRLNAYSLGGTNTCSRDKRNGLPCINDAFPDVALLPQLNIGLPRRNVFFSTESIKKEQGFYWNYGSQNPVKFGPYLELRPKETREFVQKANLQQLKSLLILSGTTHELTFDEFCQAEKFRYILSTFPVLFALILDGTLDEKESQKWLDTAYELTVVPHLPILKNLCKIATESITTKLELALFSPKASKAYFEYIQSLNARIGICSVLKIISQTNAYLHKRKLELQEQLKEDEWKDWQNNKESIEIIDNDFFDLWKKLESKIDSEMKNASSKKSKN